MTKRMCASIPPSTASTLDIGHWTTKTDSIFNFTIDQGVTAVIRHDPASWWQWTISGISTDTPARLHFFSNTLGNPIIKFFQVIDDELIAVPAGQADTVGFGVPYQVHWEGESPNIRGLQQRGPCSG